jgi:hypothetical protein
MAILANRAIMVNMPDWLQLVPWLASYLYRILTTYHLSMANCYFAKPHGMQHCYTPFFMLLISNALLVLARHTGFDDYHDGAKLYTPGE